jgi:DNA-binding response OmpR family regulator
MDIKILIIEDEPKVTSFIKKGLEVNEFKTETAYDGEIGLRKALSKNYDAIILDINLPKINGFDVCKQIRERDTRVPILMLTALGTTSDKVTGFNIGADDYLVKPFEFEELLVRIKALLKRTQPELLSDSLLKIADLEMDINSKTVKRAEKKIELTAKEFTLLEYLLRNKGRVLSRTDIAEKIWDITFDTGTNIIDLYIFYLRKKIDKDFSPKLIHTHVGMGYILKEGDE